VNSLRKNSKRLRSALGSSESRSQRVVASMVKGARPRASRAAHSTAPSSACVPLGGLGVREQAPTEKASTTIAQGMGFTLSVLDVDAAVDSLQVQVRRRARDPPCAESAARVGQGQATLGVGGGRARGARVGGGRKPRPWGARPISAERAGHRTREPRWGIGGPRSGSDQGTPRGPSADRAVRCGSTALVRPSDRHSLHPTPSEASSAMQPASDHPPTLRSVASGAVSAWPRGGEARPRGPRTPGAR
jgi:hypothetical protein